MPDLKKGETFEQWMARCVPALRKEGKEQKHAVGQCVGMWKQKKGKPKGN